MNHPLDRPIWAALTTLHQPLAEGGASAKRYPASVSPFAATPNDSAESLHALTELAAPGESLLLLMADEIVVPSGLTLAFAAPGVQMLAERLPKPIADERIVPLGRGDAPEMLELATLTKPGPFSLRALDLGAFWGVRIGGRLAAMAGERLKQPGYTELSGVSTHPDFRGKGLARLLSLHVAGQIAARGDRPYLHAYASNAAAVALYRSIGFALRSGMNAAALARPG